ncbi:hypothetical protein M0812_28454 [Anaeramoeba flamelloides]|uniref:Uncharacterized protein n=1 Tax=Anaeramoeba flamelloides TaxID=1746091 RepID=A0AAV7YBM0_9EUKA|nr:hypothetical protein M0812_28454 [Anaeramoeba flamelloides]
MQLLSLETQTKVVEQALFCSLLQKLLQNKMIIICDLSLFDHETSFNIFTQEKNNNSLSKWTKSNLKKTQTIKKLASGDNTDFLVWKKPNKLEFYQEDNKKRKYQLPKNETIKDIVSSRYNYQILTESGKVWSLANSNR